MNEEERKSILEEFNALQTSDKKCVLGLLKNRNLTFLANDKVLKKEKAGAFLFSCKSKGHSWDAVYSIILKEKQQKKF